MQIFLTRKFPELRYTYMCMYIHKMQVHVPHPAMHLTMLHAQKEIRPNVKWYVSLVHVHVQVCMHVPNPQPAGHARPSLL